MVGTRGDALEWAIALAKTPAERTSLRQRPLPEGMERLLQVAAGISGDALADTEMRTGEDAPSIIEAARFYAREILFYRGADAYRVLGLNRDASQIQVKSHHRLLQRWLHPDRHSSDWDAIFAGRVNAAWDNLRSDDRRQAYDQANPDRHGLDAPPLHGTPWLQQSHAGAAPDAGAQWRRRVPVLSLIAVCAVLGLAVIRDQQQPVDQVARDQRDRSLEPLNADMALKLPEHAGKRVERIAKNPQRSKSPQRSTPYHAIAFGSQPEPSIRSNDQLARKTVAATLPVVDVLKPVGPGVKPKVDAMAAMARTPQVPLPVSQVAASIPIERVATPATVTKAKPMEVIVASPAVRPAPPVVAVARIETRNADATASPLAIATASASSANKIQRVQQAQRVGDSLIAFMSQRGAQVPPIWNSPTAQHGASQLREKAQVEGAIKIASPRWRVNDDEAAMQAGIVYPDGTRGRLSADLVWRGEHWLVSGLTMERDL